MRFLQRADDPAKLATDLERWWAGELNARGPRFVRRYLDRRLFRRVSRMNQAEVDHALEGRAPAPVAELPRVAAHRHRHAA